MSADNATVGCDQIEKFLRNSIDVIRSDDTRTTLKDPASGQPGPKLVEIQKQVWEDLGVSPEAGRAAIGRVEKLFPEKSAALVCLREDFGKTIDSVYLQCLEDRRPSTLKKSGKMSRDEVLAFFDACNVMLDAPEVQSRLSDHIKATGTLPDSVANEVHDEVMELLGVERLHGQACFKKLGESQDFGKDRQVAIGYARWRGKTSSVCYSLLNEYRKSGGELNVDDEVREKLLEVRAQEELGAMSQEERAQLLQRNAKKVNIIQSLPPEGVARWLGQLNDEARLEIGMCQLLMERIVQSQQQGQQPSANR